MLKTKGGRGFPYCIVMDETGKVLKELRPSDETAFNGGMKPISMLMQARAAVTNAKSKSKKKTAQMNLSLMEAVFTPDEKQFKSLMKIAKKKRVDKEISAAFMSMVETYPIRKECEMADAAASKAGRDRAARERINKKRDAALYELAVEGAQIDDPGHAYFDTFYMAIANRALIVDDKKRGLAAIAKMEAKYAKNRQAMDYFGKIRRKLEKL
ncbi:MAG: hypothetical protein AAF581_18130 [Planctomycetota bacterium]